MPAFLGSYNFLVIGCVSELEMLPSSNFPILGPEVGIGLTSGFFQLNHINQGGNEITFSLLVFPLAGDGLGDLAHDDADDVFKAEPLLQLLDFVQRLYIGAADICRELPLKPEPDGTVSASSLPLPH